MDSNNRQLFLRSSFLVLVISAHANGVNDSFFDAQPDDVDYFLYPFEFLTCSLNTGEKEAIDKSYVRRDGSKTHITVKAMDCAYEGVRLKFDGDTFHTITYDSNLPGVMVDNRVYCSMDALRNPDTKFMKTPDGTIWYSNCPIGKSFSKPPAGQTIGEWGKGSVDSALQSAGNWGKQGAESATQSVGNWGKKGVDSVTSTVGNWGRRKLASAGQPLGKVGRRGADAVSNKVGGWGMKGVNSATESIGNLGRKGSDKVTQTAGRWAAQGGEALKSKTDPVADKVDQWMPKSILKKKKEDSSPPTASEWSELDSSRNDESSSSNQALTPTGQQLAQKYDMSSSPLNNFKLVKSGRQSPISSPNEKSPARSKPPLPKQRRKEDSPFKPKLLSKISDIDSKEPSRASTYRDSKQSPNRPSTRPKAEPKKVLEKSRRNRPSSQGRVSDSASPPSKNRPKLSSSKSIKSFKKATIAPKKSPKSSSSDKSERDSPPRKKKPSRGGPKADTSQGLLGVKRKRVVQKGNAPPKKVLDKWYPRNPDKRRDPRRGGKKKASGVRKGFR